MPPPAPGIRPAVRSDLPALLALENLAFRTDRLSRRSLRDLIRSPHAALSIAERGGALLGYSLVLFRRSSAAARLYSIAVAPQAARTGVGRVLLAASETQAALRNCATLRLEVDERNTAALALYRHAGYRVFARRTHYYEDGGHALRLEKALAP